MNIIQNNSLLIIGILLISLLFAGLIIYIQYVKLKKNKYKGGSSATVSKDEYEKLKKEYNKVNEHRNTLINNYSDLRNERSSIAKSPNDEVSKLNKIIDDLKRENAELKKFFNKESAHVAEQLPIAVVTSIDSPKQESQGVASKQEQPKQEEQIAKEALTISTETLSSEEITTNEGPSVVSIKEVVMYASFPRSAGSSIYFSDLTEVLVDDSFFELKISNANGIATFKPLDFMKIRNYDPAMAAMLTDGVKPNIASTVLGIEPGEAHIEGKDWIIDNPAKIKLA